MPDVRFAARYTPSPPDRSIAVYPPSWLIKSAFSFSPLWLFTLAAPFAAGAAVGPHSPLGMKWERVVAFFLFGGILPPRFFKNRKPSTHSLFMLCFS